MDKVTVIALVLMPSVVWAFGKLVDYLERRRDRREAKAREADYHSRSVIVQAPLRLGSDSGSGEDSDSGSESR